jgi:hypothetical protein
MAQPSTTTLPDVLNFAGVTPGSTNMSLPMNQALRVATTPGSPIFVGKQTNYLVPLLVIGGVAAAIYFL